MGTTLTVVLIKGSSVVVGHVGDSRLYHIRGNGIISRTKDQTELQKLLDDGVISKRRALNYHRKNVLLSVLSDRKDYELEISKFKIEDDDRLILLTDGAYTLLKKVEIRDASIQAYNPAELLKVLEKTIEQREIADDYSCIVLQNTSGT